MFAIIAGLLPIMWSTGSEIMRHTAVPMTGGMVSSTPLALIVMRAIFGPVKSSRCLLQAKLHCRRIRKQFEKSASSEACRLAGSRSFSFAAIFSILRN